MDPQIINLKRKVAKYKEVLQNTEKYRLVWRDNLKQYIIDSLQGLLETTGLDANIEVVSEIENLDAVVVSLGESKSGMYQQVADDIQQHLIKHNGSLIYQQLFNGKVIVMIQYPYIDGYGEPSEPRTIAIYRPEELNSIYLARHLEEFIQEITKWEDYDDDEPHKKIGFNLNFPTPDREPG
jgi:hypothetical protein